MAKFLLEVNTELLRIRLFPSSTWTLRSYVSRTGQRGGSLDPVLAMKLSAEGHPLTGTEADLLSPEDALIPPGEVARERAGRTHPRRR